MIEMVERVAKAIAETIALAHIKHNLREIGQEDKLEEYLKMFPIKLTLADSDVARAAIEAMREPTDAMVWETMTTPLPSIAECGGIIEQGKAAIKIQWQVMVGEALK
jgi:hypothetical protein